MPDFPLVLFPWLVNWRHHISIPSLWSLSTMLGSLFWALMAFVHSPIIIITVSSFCNEKLFVCVHWAFLWKRHTHIYTSLVPKMFYSSYSQQVSAKWAKIIANIYCMPTVCQALFQVFSLYWTHSILITILWTGAYNYHSHSTRG